jgi:hypothetical protein
MPGLHFALVGRLTRVVYRQGGREHEAAADQVILGANAIFSAEILLRSGFDDGIIGRHLHEQLAYAVEAWVDGLDYFDGGSASTGINYALFDGPHRASAGAVHMIVRNQPEHGLRLEPGRWRRMRRTCMARCPWAAIRPTPASIHRAGIPACAARRPRCETTFPRYPASALADHRTGRAPAGRPSGLCSAARRTDPPAARRHPGPACALSGARCCRAGALCAGFPAPRRLAPATGDRSAWLARAVRDPLAGLGQQQRRGGGAAAGRYLGWPGGCINPFARRDSA